jgi:hypothetical protein
LEKNAKDDKSTKAREFKTCAAGKQLKTLDKTHILQGMKGVVVGDGFEPSKA